jgi:hypothetical protein
MGRMGRMVFALGSLAMAEVLNEKFERVVMPI